MKEDCCKTSTSSLIFCHGCPFRHPTYFISSVRLFILQLKYVSFYILITIHRKNIKNDNYENICYHLRCNWIYWRENTFSVYEYFDFPLYTSELFQPLCDDSFEGMVIVQSSQCCFLHWNQYIIYVWMSVYSTAFCV